MVIALGPMATAARAQQLTPEAAAMMVLDSARRAYNEKKYTFAAGRFREFLKGRGAHKEAPSAHYGLALSLLEAPQKDYNGAIQSLQQVVAVASFPDRPSALYHMGVARRGLGDKSLAQAAAIPAQAAAHRSAATQQFEQAAKSFADAAAAFAARAKKPPAGEAKVPAELEWAARARCDQCEMLLRVGKFQEAGKLAGGFLADPVMAGSRYRPLALYHLGYSHFRQRDYLAAGRALSRLAPFEQEFGVHARYLLARTHHLAEERPEAAAQYKAVLAGYEDRKKKAQAALAKPAALTPARKASLAALVKGPPPDYILRASFHLALLAAEEGRHAEALAGFSSLIQKYPKSALVPEAQLRVGYCQMQLRNFPEAVKALQPLTAHRQLSDQALWWLGRAQVGGADPKNPPVYAQALAAGIATLGRAAAAAAALAASDPDAKIRRGDILLELADTQQLAKQYKQAAATYQLALTENNNPDRAEEAMQRQVTALHLAGQHAQSDALCAKFEKTFPKSTLLPAVLFRGAENAYQAAAAATKAPNLPNRQQKVSRLLGEAISRYERLLRKYPDFAHANVARYGMASAHYQLGKYADAAAVLAGIPEVERAGALAAVGYVQADCLIRALPDETGDAVGAARLAEQAGRAAKLLESFLAAQPKAPQAADALLKLGHCHQRVGAVLADDAERTKALTLARGAYDRFFQQFAAHPSVSTAVFERAKCLALLGDVNGAIGQLGRFRADPFRLTPVGPLALCRLAGLLRAQNRAAEGAAVLAQCRAWHEANLLKDPARKEWVALLQYEHGLALKDSGKLAEARAMFEALAKQFPGRPEAVNAVWRGGQCRREELMAALAAAGKTLAAPAAKPPQIAAAKQAVADGLRGLYQTVDSLLVHARKLAGPAAGSEPHLRMLYEAAWCYRALAEAEIEASRRQLQREALERVRGQVAGRMPAGQAPPALLPPEIPLEAISLRPAESAAHAQYKAIIAGAPEAPLAVRARLELAEMYARRGSNDAALALLSEAMLNNPPDELAERIRLCLAGCFLARNDTKAALAQARAVTRNAASPLAGQARLLAAEAFIQRRDWAGAIKQLSPFYSQAALRNIPGLSDRAFLRLGWAQGQAGQWNASRQTLTVLVQRFPKSPCVCEALYGIGWAWQSQKRYDQAAAAYVQVTGRTAAEVAARAQLQIGLCRLEQKRYRQAADALLVVPLTYDYPECSARAWFAAGRAYLALKQPAEAAKAWNRVVKDYPTSESTKAARRHLSEIK